MKTVLVVDDNEDLREVAVEALRREGYRVLEAGNGKRALEILAELEQAPSVVLLDITMPVMNGRQFLAALADRPLLASIPVIVLSAIGGEDVRGASRMLRKPVTAEALVGVARQYCGEFGKGALDRPPSRST
jgi:CheY-like chemotaxis protein